MFSKRIDSTLPIPFTFYAFQNIPWAEVVNARLPKYSETRTLPKFLRRGLTQKLSLAESERAVLCNGRERERERERESKRAISRVGEDVAAGQKRLPFLYMRRQNIYQQLLTCFGLKYQLIMVWVCELNRREIALDVSDVLSPHFSSRIFLCVSLSTLAPSLSLSISLRSYSSEK